MLVVYLAVAMLAAIGTARLMAGGRRARTIAGGLALLLAVECAPASPPIFTPEIASQYAALKERDRAGAVCELPLGIRDGFGETGRFDSSVLLHQTVHERPIVGGFLARLPPDIGSRYGAMPVMGSFLRLSSGGRLSDEPSVTPRDGTSTLASSGIAFVVLDTRTAPADLVRYVQSLSLHVIAEEDGRIFYEVN